jgi:hypothetical protein
MNHIVSFWFRDEKSPYKIEEPNITETVNKTNWVGITTVAS